MDSEYLSVSQEIIREHPLLHNIQLQPSCLNLASLLGLIDLLQFQEGIVVAGGYYNGISTMFMPFHG